MDYLRLKLTALALAATFASPIACFATSATPPAHQPLLQCHVSYAGTTHSVQARPVADPYSVPSVDIGGRFLFKAVMVGLAQRIDYIKLYAYLDARHQPVLLHEAKYLPPFPRSKKPVLLTGEQFLYGGPVERELIYSCTLEGVV